ncbi:hypothetical protein GEMRC1_012422 [Eukaryota sp. GEM-RC1]
MASRIDVKVLSPRRAAPQYQELNTSGLYSDSEHLPSPSSPLPTNHPSTTLSASGSPSISYYESPDSSDYDDLSLDVTTQLSSLENRLIELSDLSKKEKDELVNSYETKLQQLESKLSFQMKLNDELEDKQRNARPQTLSKQEKQELSRSYETQIQRLESQLSAFKISNANLEKKVQQHSMEVVDTSSFESKIESLESDLVAQKRLTFDLQKQLQEAPTTIDIHPLETKIENLEENLKCQTNLNNELQLQLDEWSSEYASLQEKYEKEIERLLRDRMNLSGVSLTPNFPPPTDDNKADHDRLLHQLQSIKIDCNQFKTLYEKERDRNHQLSDDIEMLQRQRGEALERQRDEFQSIIDELGSRIRKLEDDKVKISESLSREKSSDITRVVSDLKNRHLVELRETVDYERESVRQEVEQKYIKNFEELRKKMRIKEDENESLKVKINEQRNIIDKMQSEVNGISQNFEKKGI